MQAGQTICPNCGAPANELARHCEYCRAPIATVRCARCYQMNVPEALHCSGCGWELGLEPLSEPDSLSCPWCRERLQAFSGDGGRLHDCAHCGGQFVEHGLLLWLLERRAVVGRAVPRRVPQENPLLQPVRYLRCPCCDVLMNRKNFGGSSGIIVDICSQHGSWFDSGELPHVLTFVESGGLDRARAKRRRLAGAESPAFTPYRREAGASEPSPLSGWVDPVLELWSLVTSLAGDKAD